jgi:hypothetical protein
MAKTLYNGTGSLNMSKMKIGNAILASIELSETNLVR